LSKSGCWNGDVRRVKQLTIRWASVVRLVLDLPSLDTHLDRIFIPPNQMTKLRRFLTKSIPTSEAALEGGTFTITALAKVREHQGDRQIVLTRWKTGESVPRALKDAADKLERLRPKTSN